MHRIDKFNIHVHLTLLTLLSVVLYSSQVVGQELAQSIPVVDLAAAPVVDGKAGEWAAVPTTTISLKPNPPETGARAVEVTLRVGIHGEHVYFFASWPDTTRDELHKPWLWDNIKGKYVTGPQREDRFALQFGMTPEYTPDWLSGKAFRADMWHWKANRTNPLGLAHDKSTRISLQKLPKSLKMTARDGQTIYLLRPSDSGSKLYKSKRYRKQQEPLMPKYILAESAEGSVADVQATGRWQDGAWHLEMRRRLDTGHDDDIRFIRGTPVKAAIAVFDHGENDGHAISAPLILQF